MSLLSANHACDRARAQISSRVDGELSELENARLDLHLSQCGACRIYEADVESATRMVRATQLEPIGFQIALPRRRRLALSQFERVTAVAAAAAIGIGSMLSIGGTPAKVGEFAQTRHARPAYLDSSNYEQRMIELARSKPDDSRSSGAVHV